MEIILSSSDKYQKVVTLSKWTSDNGNVSHWVDIRTFWFKEEERLPTRKGVMLKLNEFEKILPFLYYRNECSDIITAKYIPLGPAKKDLFKENRVIQTRKNEKNEYMMDIILKTLKKETCISITYEEVLHLWGNKEYIRNFFENN